MFANRPLSRVSRPVSLAGIPVRNPLASRDHKSLASRDRSTDIPVSIHTSELRRRAADTLGPLGPPVEFIDALLLELGTVRPRLRCARATAHACGRRRRAAPRGWPGGRRSPRSVAGFVDVRRVGHRLLVRGAGLAGPRDAAWACIAGIAADLQCPCVPAHIDRGGAAVWSGKLDALDTVGHDPLQLDRLRPSSGQGTRWRRSSPQRRSVPLACTRHRRRSSLAICAVSSREHPHASRVATTHRPSSLSGSHKIDYRALEVAASDR